LDIKKKLESQEPDEEIIFFDEFATTDRQSTYYSWAEKNTRPQIKSNEKNWKKTNGLLSVNLQGKEYIKFTDKSRSEQIAEYFLQLSQDLQKDGYKKLTIILDNNPSHKNKMRIKLKELLEENKIKNFKITFINTPRYSPNFNLAEYIIHLLRLRFMHHHKSGITIEELKNIILNGIKQNHMMTEKQIENTLNHIYALI